MSIQACEIRGIGYKFDYNEDLFSFISDVEDEQEFIDVIDVAGGYYSMKDLKSNNKISPLRIFIDGMNGEYKYVLIVTEATYIENTHGDNRWKNKYRDDEFIRKNAKKRIETLLQRKFEENPNDVVFEHYQ